MYKRTYGWVQNPSDFKTLKKVVQIFDSQSGHYKELKESLIQRLIPFKELKDRLQSKFDSGETIFTYLELVGSSKNNMGKAAKKRADAVADGLIQISVIPQGFKRTGKEWTDNWTSDGYLRWALSLNFIEHNRDSDECRITNHGLAFSRSDDETDCEIKILREAMLRYPPATRVLKILERQNKPVTKYFIGDRLGFKGEKGFTSYPEKLMKDWFANADKEERKKIKSDVEGTSDKYARMIAGWLSKLGFVNIKQKKVSLQGEMAVGFPEYEITALGKHELGKAEGNSKNTKKEKFITWEFLAVDGERRDYARTRRAYILQFLKQTKSMNVLYKNMKDKGFEDRKTIENDILGLNMIGVRIERRESEIELKDRLNDITIPNIDVTAELKKESTNIRKECMMKTTDLPIKYYELIDIAYDGTRNRDFEMVTMDLLVNMYGFNGKHLGGGRKPDGIVYCSDYGIIIDTKAYENGYSKNINQEDEMVRYIEDNQKRDMQRNPTKWWSAFEENDIDEYYFMWISSFFTGRFGDQIISTMRRTSTHGACMNVEQLLLGADLINKKKLQLFQLKKFFNNKEVYWLEETGKMEGEEGRTLAFN